jgi:hypothetical protein
MIGGLLASGEPLARRPSPENKKRASHRKTAFPKVPALCLPYYWTAGRIAGFDLLPGGENATGGVEGQSILPRTHLAKRETGVSIITVCVVLSSETVKIASSEVHGRWLDVAPRHAQPWFT